MKRKLSRMAARFLLWENRVNGIIKHRGEFKRKAGSHAPGAERSLDRGFSGGILARKKS